MSSGPRQSNCSVWERPPPRHPDALKRSQRLGPVPRWNKKQISNPPVLSRSGAAGPSPARGVTRAALCFVICFSWQRGVTRSTTTVLGRVSQSRS